jgi:hypothetical protein
MNRMTGTPEGERDGYLSKGGIAPEQERRGWLTEMGRPKNNVTSELDCLTVTKVAQRAGRRPLIVNYSKPQFCPKKPY